MSEIDYYEYSDALGWDLAAALEWNGLAEYLPRISHVLAVVEGENDGPHWHWIVALKDPATFAYINGWCDYTGWDCQSEACVEETATVDASLALVEDETPWGSSWEKYYGAKPSDLLRKQIADNQKSETWRESIARQYPEMNIEFTDLSSDDRPSED